ncbi:LysE family translocator [Neptunomonas sp. XY-337]|uniref:LysE family translocator n=1 Tax=Neptunomonas sp. XY-337 TaxID=2561897 RepID=UPI0010AA3462|nr:LysE family translocator [Neptunomonas sp. XY-337]
MTLASWLSLLAICVLGAMTPGPSLAVVLRHTLTNGRLHGVVSGVAHAAGVAGWAILTVWGLALLVTTSPLVFNVITYAGAGYLAYLGVKALRAQPSSTEDAQVMRVPLYQAALDGLMISLLNPKLAIFFLALFSQFVTTAVSLESKSIMIATVTAVDGAWYTLVAIVLSHSRVLGKLQSRTFLIERISGGILIALALRVLTL